MMRTRTAALVGVAALCAALDGGTGSSNSVPHFSGEVQMDAPLYVRSSAIQRDAAVATDGIDYFVVWEDLRGEGGILGSRLDASGRVLDPAGIVVRAGPETESSPDVAFDGSDYVVVWTERPESGPAAVLAARIRDDGTVLDDVPIVIDAGTQSTTQPAVARAATGTLIVWKRVSTGSSDLYGARLSADGVVMDTPALAIADVANESVDEPDVAFGGSEHLVSWRDSRDDVAVYAARVRGSTVLDPGGFVVSGGAGARYAPRVAFGAGLYLVAWEDERSGYQNRSVFSARVDSTGTVLDPGGIPVSEYDGVWRNDPEVGFDGSGFLVVWRLGSGWGDGVYGARVDPTGTVLDPAGFTIAQSDGNQHEHTLASRAGQTLVVFQNGSSIPAHDIAAVRVAPDTTVLDSEVIDISLGANNQVRAAVASDGTDYLVVWQDDRQLSTRGFDVYGARVSARGELLDPDGLVISSAQQGQEAPAVCFDGEQYIVVWHDRRDGELDVRGARVSREGQLIDPDGFAVAASPTNEAFPSIASNGSVTLIAWSHGGGLDPDVHAARLDRSGSVLDPDGITIAEASGQQHSTSIASDGTEFLLTWHDARSGTHEIYAARVGATGAVLDPSGFVVSRIASPQYNPRIAWGSGSYLVAWQGERAAGSSIYAARVSSEGQVLDLDATTVTADGINTQPAVVWFDRSFLVAWSRRDDGLGAARIDATGLLDPTPFSASAEPYAHLTPALASNGVETALLTYHRFDSSPIFRSDRARARLVTLGVPDGGVGASFPIDGSADAEQVGPDASPAGTPPNIDAMDESSDRDTGDDLDAGRQGGGPRLDAVNPSGGCGCETVGMSGDGRGLVGWLVLVVFGVCRQAIGRNRRRDIRRSAPSRNSSLSAPVLVIKGPGSRALRRSRDLWRGCRSA